MLLTQTKKIDSIVLYNIAWQQFENLLENLGDSRSASITYDEGRLEIMSPLPEHEYLKERISDTIKEAAEMLDLDFECLGSTTWKREIKKAGIEPDNCFYFQNEPLIRGKLVFDLNHDPPPDLALEIDLSSKSINRFPIYARLEVPEIWCYDSGELKIYQLEGDSYLQKEVSSIFPNFNITKIPLLIQRYRQQGRKIFIKAVKEWLYQQINY
ncbi:MAG: Uma2 family endonuclease [Crocosphaera sp.]|nr:Uma2 family endonuclease [Crocosphaera sp.]